MTSRRKRFRPCCPRDFDHLHESILRDALQLLLEERKKRQYRGDDVVRALGRQEDRCIYLAKSYLTEFINNVQENPAHELVFASQKAKPLVTEDEEAAERTHKERLA